MSSIYPSLSTFMPFDFTQRYFCSIVWLMHAELDTSVQICWGGVVGGVIKCDGNFSIFSGVLISPLPSERTTFCGAVSMETRNYPRHQQFMLNNFSIDRMGMLEAAVPPTPTTLHIPTTSFSSVLITAFKWNAHNMIKDTTAYKLLHNTEWWSKQWHSQLSIANMNLTSGFPLHAVAGQIKGTNKVKKSVGDA